MPETLPTSDHVLETLGYIRAKLDELHLDMRTHLEHDERVHSAQNTRIQALEVESLKRAAVRGAAGKWVNTGWAVLGFGIATFARLLPFGWH